MLLNGMWRGMLWWRLMRQGAVSQSKALRPIHFGLTSCLACLFSSCQVATANGNLYCIATSAAYHPMKSWPQQHVGGGTFTAR